MIDAVVFDFGGVLTMPVRSATAAWLADDAIAPDSFRTVMQAWLGPDTPEGSPVHLLETGQLSGPEFERVLAARLLTVAGGPVLAEGLLARLFAGMQPDLAMLDLVTELRGAGLRLGLLSNSWANDYPDELRARFDAVVISGEVGLRKPDPRIYHRMLADLAVPATRTAFVDDVPVNIDAANGLGIRGIHHVDAVATRAALDLLLPGLVAGAVRDHA